VLADFSAKVFQRISMILTNPTEICYFLTIVARTLRGGILGKFELNGITVNMGRHLSQNAKY
jgi:hypothetical protein